MVGLVAQEKREVTCLDEGCFPNEHDHPVDRRSMPRDFVSGEIFDCAQAVALGNPVQQVNPRDKKAGAWRS